MLSIFLDIPFCIAPSIFSYVFLIKEIILYLIVIQLSVFQQNSVYVVCKITIFIAFHKYFNVMQYIAVLQSSLMLNIVTYSFG